MPRWTSFAAFLKEALNAPLESRQPLVDALLMERPNWPWVEGDKATFIYARPGARSVAVNLDTIKEDPPFVPMQNLPGTTLWNVTLKFAPDDLLDYMIVINDPMTPLKTEPNLVARVQRYWSIDPYNPTHIDTAQMNVSVLRMGEARPFPDWAKLQRVAHGKVYEHAINSNQLNFTGRKLWVYTPPGYDASSQIYPLLLLSDGQWSIGPLQVPGIADALIKHGQMEPIVIAMVQTGDRENRLKNYVANNRHYLFLLTELLPFIQTQYRIDAANLGVGGVGIAAAGAIHAALSNPAVFSRLVMISPPLGKGEMYDELKQYFNRFDRAAALPKRIFQSVGRYESRARFYMPALALRELLRRRQDIAYKFVELGSGHGLVAFRSILPEALAFAYPGEVASGS
jgi:enterochelin esterase-like enzyme